MNQPSPSAKDRKLSNFLICPQKQFRLAFLTVAIGLFVFLAFFGFELWILSSLITSLAPLAPPESDLHSLLADSLRWSWVAFIVFAFVFALATLLGTIVLSHRLYGPMVALRKHVRALVRGEYEYRTQLRKNDDLKELAADLNDLSDCLSGKKINS